MSPGPPLPEAPRRVLALFAKQPVAGHVKTRLAAASSHRFAAAVAEAFLLDLLDRLDRVPAQRILVFAPDTAAPYFVDLAAGRFHLTPQRGNDLGQRLANFLTDQLASALAPILLVGTDSPTLPLAFIDQAFSELERADVVLGPATDGGYYLVGCARSLPPIFHDIPWSTRRVLAATIQRLQSTPLRIALLPPWYDVDTMDDWHMLCGHLSAMRRAGLDPGCPRVEQLIRESVSSTAYHSLLTIHHSPLTTHPPMPTSVLLSSLPLDFEPAVRQAAALGFTHVDVVALADRPPSHREALADTGLVVSCAALGRDLPEGFTLDAASAETRLLAVQTVQRHLADAAALGATHAYLIPGMDSSAEGLARFAEACTLLADFAAARMVRLCIEHIPGRALPTVERTLAWLNQLAHPNLALLLDVGHCQISDEDPAAAVRQAGHRFGYVHFDDNDAVSDLHWPLMMGKLTADTIRAVLDALREVGYSATVTLELSPQNPDPVAALRQGKGLLEAE
jgi:rSAM/selenodomain-associated transferase 1